MESKDSKVPLQNQVFFNPPSSVVSKSELLWAVQFAKQDVKVWRNEQGIFLYCSPASGCGGYAQCQGSSLMICGGVAQRCNPCPELGDLFDAWETVLSSVEAVAVGSFISVLYQSEGTWTKMRMTLRQVTHGRCNASQRVLDNDYAFVNVEHDVLWSLASAAVYFFINSYTSCGRKDNQPRRPHPESIYLDSTDGESYFHTQNQFVAGTEPLITIPFALALSRDDIYVSNVEASALGKVSLNILPFVLQCVVYKSPLNPEESTNVFDLVKYTDAFWNKDDPEWRLMREYLRLIMSPEEWKKNKSKLRKPQVLATFSLAQEKALVPRTTAHAGQIPDGNCEAMYLRAERAHQAVPMVDCAHYGSLDIVGDMQAKLDNNDITPLLCGAKFKVEESEDANNYICNSVIMACKGSYLRMAVKAKITSKPQRFLSVRFKNFDASRRLASQITERELTDAIACIEAVLDSESTHVGTLEFVMNKVKKRDAKALIKKKYGNPSKMKYESISMMATQCAYIAKVARFLRKDEGNANDLQQMFTDMNNPDLVQWAVNREFEARSARTDFAQLGVYCVDKMAKRAQLRELLKEIDDSVKLDKADWESTALFFSSDTIGNAVFESCFPRVQSHLIDAMFRFIEVLKRNGALARFKTNYGESGFWAQCGFNASAAELEDSRALLKLCKKSDCKKKAAATSILSKLRKGSGSRIKLCHLWKAYQKDDAFTGLFSAYLKKYNRMLVDFPICMQPPGPFGVGAEVYCEGEHRKGEIVSYNKHGYSVDFGNDELDYKDAADLKPSAEPV